MEEVKIDREAMGRLAKALAFICGPDHPTTVALNRAVIRGTTGQEDLDRRRDRVPIF